MWLPYKILCVTLHILLLPLSLIFLLLLGLYKLLAVSLARSFHNFEGSIPSENSVYFPDRIWSKPSASIVAVIELQGNFSTETLTSDFQKAYDMRDDKGRRCYRELGYHVVGFMGYGFWKKVDNFRMADRMKVVKVDGKPSTSNIAEIAQSLQRKPFQEDEPLWDVNLLFNYNGDPNKTIMFWRYHHLLADGISIVKLCYAMTGSSQLPESFTKASRSLTTWHKYTSGLLVKTAYFANLCAVGIIDYLEALIFHKDKINLNFDGKGNFRGNGESICSLGDVVLSVEQLKTAGRHYKCSIVHLTLTAVSTGLERYMAKYLGGEGEEEGNADKGFHYVVSLPVPGHPDMRLVNHWCMSKLYSTPDIQQTQDRIEYFKEETKRCVSSSLPFTSAMVLKYLAGLFPTTLSKFMLTGKASSTVALSNVVGPPDNERILGGCNLTSMLFWLPLFYESIALSVGVISCNGGLRLCLTADEGCVPGQSRLDELTMMITEELLEICKMS